MRPHARGMLLASTAALLAAVFLIAYRGAQAHAPRSAVVLAMLFGAAVFNTGTALFTTRGGLKVDRTAVLTVLGLGLFTILGNVGVAESLGRMEPALTAVLIQTQVLIVAFLARIFLGEPITLRFLIGAGVALGGVLLLNPGDPSQGGARSGVSLVGALWALSAALSFACMQVITRKVIARIQPVAVNAARLWLAVGLFALVPGQLGGLRQMPAEGWALALLASLCGPFLSRLCLMYALRFIPASQSVLFGLLGPVLAFALALLFFGTAPGPSEIAGGLVILTGVALPLYEGWKKAQREPPKEEEAEASKAE